MESGPTATSRESGSPSGLHSTELPSGKETKSPLLFRNEGAPAQPRRGDHRLGEKIGSLERGEGATCNCSSHPAQSGPSQAAGEPVLLHGSARPLRAPQAP